MNLHFVEKFSEGDKDAQLEAMRKYFKLVSAEEADFIYCASIDEMEKANYLTRVHNKPLAIYCWDYYKWAHEGKAPYWDWARYAEFLKKAQIIFVPSAAQQLRLKELLNLDSIVVRTGITTYDLPVTDKGFILDPLRYYEADENAHWAEQAAKELDIPLVHSEHGYSQEEFRKLVASCTFITSCVREASTGALTLMEGLYLGKPCLVSDSPYMGARSYLGGYGYYFKHDQFDDLIYNMKLLWSIRPPKLSGREYVKTFTYDRMAKELHANLYSYIKGNRGTL